MSLIGIKKAAIIAAGGLSLLLAAAPLCAQNGGQPAANAATENLPSAREVMERYLQVTGGRDAYEKMTTRHSKGKIDIPAQGISGTNAVWQAAPNKMRMKMEIPQFGTQENGTDGQTVWEMSMMGGRIITGEERAAALRMATFNSELQWESLYESVTLRGVEDVDGRPAYALELVPKDGGNKAVQYFDKESGLMVRTTTVMKSQMGELPVDTTVSDYRDVGGILVPFKTVQSVMGMQIIMSFTEVNHNVEMPEGIFDLPDFIKDIKKAEDEMDGGQ